MITEMVIKFKWPVEFQEKSKILYKINCFHTLHWTNFCKCNFPYPRHMLLLKNTHLNKEIFYIK